MISDLLFVLLLYPCTTVPSATSPVVAGAAPGIGRGRRRIPGGLATNTSIGAASRSVSVSGRVSQPVPASFGRGRGTSRMQTRPASVDSSVSSLSSASVGEATNRCATASNSVPGTPVAVKPEASLQSADGKNGTDNGLIRIPSRKGSSSLLANAANQVADVPAGGSDSRASQCSTPVTSGKSSLGLDLAVAGGVADAPTAACHVKAEPKETGTTESSNLANRSNQSEHGSGIRTSSMGHKSCESLSRPVLPDYSPAKPSTLVKPSKKEPYKQSSIGPPPGLDTSAYAVPKPAGMVMSPCAGTPTQPTQDDVFTEPPQGHLPSPALLQNVPLPEEASSDGATASSKPAEEAAATSDNGSQINSSNAVDSSKANQSSNGSTVPAQSPVNGTAAPAPFMSRVRNFSSV